MTVDESAKRDLMTLEDVEALFLHRQSCRSFDKNRPVSEEVLKKVCDLALLAPSACNTQPWKLYIVTGEKIKPIMKAVQSKKLNHFVDDATAFIIVAEGKGNFATTMGTLFDYSDFTHNDIGIMVGHLILAADAAGLGTCILGWRSEKKIIKELNLPKGTRIPEVIAVGYPAEDYKIRPKKRKPDTETLHFIHD